MTDKYPSDYNTDSLPGTIPVADLLAWRNNLSDEISDSWLNTRKLVERNPQLEENVDVRLKIAKTAGMEEVLHAFSAFMISQTGEVEPPEFT